MNDQEEMFQRVLQHQDTAIALIKHYAEEGYPASLYDTENILNPLETYAGLACQGVLSAGSTQLSLEQYKHTIALVVQTAWLAGRDQGKKEAAVCQSEQ